MYFSFPILISLCKYLYIKTENISEYLYDMLRLIYCFGFLDNFRIKNNG